MRGDEASITCEPVCPWDKVVTTDTTEFDLETLFVVSVMNWVEAVSSMLTDGSDRQD